MTEGNKEQDGIWIIDAEGRTSYVNERMAEILGAPRSDVMGRSSFEYIFPEDLSAAQDLFAAKKDGHIRHFGFKLCRQDGSAGFVEVHGTPRFKCGRSIQGCGWHVHSFNT